MPKAKKSLALRIYNMHGFYLKLGQRIGTPFVKYTAYFALYKIFTSGGAESVAYCCYEHMIREGEKEFKKSNANRQNKTQS